MLDADLANLYGVETKVLNQAVGRNRERFPDDFMFQLSRKDLEHLRSQFVTSSWGGRRYPPYAFTEQGVAMLSSVLRSKRAAQVNVAIMRTFVKLRRMLATIEALAARWRGTTSRSPCCSIKLASCSHHPRRERGGPLASPPKGLKSWVTLR